MSDDLEETWKAAGYERGNYWASHKDHGGFGFRDKAKRDKFVKQAKASNADRQAAMALHKSINEQPDKLKTFKEMVEEVNGTVSAREKLKKAKKGDTMSFTHHKYGEVSGEYHGIKRMGPHSYASVEVKGKGKFYVPLHQVTHHPKPKDVKENLDEGRYEVVKKTSTYSIYRNKATNKLIKRYPDGSFDPITSTKPSLSRVKAKPKVNKQADQDLDEAARSTELKVGHMVSFDHPEHGKIHGKIYHTDGQHASIEVKHTKHFGSRFKVAHDKLTRVTKANAAG